MPARRWRYKGGPPLLAVVERQEGLAGLVVEGQGLVGVLMALLYNRTVGTAFEGQPGAHSLGNPDNLQLVREHAMEHYVYIHRRADTGDIFYVGKGMRTARGLRRGATPTGTPPWPRAATSSSP